MARLGIRYDLLTHEGDILRLQFWDRAFELLKEQGADPARDRGQERGLLGAADGRGRRARRSTRTRSSSARTAPSPTSARTSPTSSGSSASSTATSATACTARSPDGHRLWTTTSGEGEPGAPRVRPRARGLQRDRRRPVVPAARGEGRRRGARPRARRPRARHHLAYEKVVLSPATARALGYEVTEDEAVRQGLGPQGPRREGRRPAGRARGQGPRRGRGAQPRARRRRARGHGRGAVAVGALRYFMLKLLAHADHHLRHRGGARLHGRDRPLPAERGGARPQHLRQAARRRATSVDGARSPARARSTSARSSPARRATWPGRCCC